MFARTVWSDDYQAQAILDLVDKLGLKSLKPFGSIDDTLSEHLFNYIRAKRPGLLCTLTELPNEGPRDPVDCDNPDENWRRFLEEANNIIDSKFDAFLLGITGSTKKLFLRSLQCAMEGKEKRSNRTVQLIGTDTWGITDDLAENDKVELITLVQSFNDDTELKMNEHLFHRLNRSTTNKNDFLKNVLFKSIRSDEGNLM